MVSKTTPRTLSWTDAFLVAEDLVCEKGDLRLINKLCLRLSAGEALVATGPNGVGKTTLLRALAGLDRPTSGAVKVGPNNQETDQRLIHFLGMRDGLKAQLSLIEHLDLWARILSRPKPSNWRDLCQQVRLNQQAELPLGALSSGQRRRAAMALLILDPRPIWILDEPMNALDAEMRQSFMTPLLQTHVASGGILVAATHLPLGIPNTRRMELIAGAHRFVDDDNGSALT